MRVIFSPEAVAVVAAACVAVFSLSQLLAINVYGLKVERDMYFKPRKLSEICHKPVKEYIDHYYKED